MIEILPLKSLRDEDAPIFGLLNVKLSKLSASGLPVCRAFVVTPPNLKLKTILEQHDFASYEVIEQSFTLVRNELDSIPVPDILRKELNEHKQFLVDNQLVKGLTKLWSLLLNTWLEDLKKMIWNGGFEVGITENLESKVVVLVKDLKAFGKTSFSQMLDEEMVEVLGGKLKPEDLKKVADLVDLANKKLIIQHEFNWVLDNGFKLCGINPNTPVVIASTGGIQISGSQVELGMTEEKAEKGAVKMLLDLSVGEIPGNNFNGIYLTGERIYDLNKPQDSFDKLVLKIVETGNTGKPVLLKIADKSEGMGKVRGALRLIHQKSLLDSFIEAINFIKNQKVWRNIQLVVPFVRGINEFSEVKKLLAMKKLTRGNLVQIWMEICIPENVINMEEYIVTGLDGFVLNMDELMSHISGFDLNEQELLYYKKDLKALFNFLEDGLKTAHKMKVPIIATGSIVLYPEVLEFLVEKGVYGVVVERYEADAGRDLLLKMEKKNILKRSS